MTKRHSPTRRPATLALCLGAAAILAGCANEAGLSVTGGFNREAGSVIDRGDFGAATKNNIAVLSGEKSYTISLARRFDAEVPSTVNFAFNSARLEPGAREILRRQAAWIRQFPEVRFRVFGHTDLVGSDAYNKRLGLARAQAVVQYLGSQGISLDRLEAVVSFGETQPLIATQNRERRNRRTVTEVSGFVQGHQNVLDGKYAQIIYREYVNSAEPTSTLNASSSLGEASGE
ncbi:OmpA family protein [Roseivivax sp. GX 12232]|uniref:OmpA family protein n=1 Tax=Roseivivax sp. GX 12232 TaxID=2900547 RepID=UPI001E4CF6F9|nr:OmpA family protein [Roseivivax sp. GX 12232]MCE0504422.1 OmpA family protein [Roseivivax sp. GX 12232]